MTKESENAAKWEIIEQYKEACSKLVAISHQCGEIGSAIATFGHALAEFPERVLITSERVTYPKYAGAPAFERNKTEIAAFHRGDHDLASIKSLIDEYNDTLKLKVEAEQKIQDLGINPTGLLR